MSAISWPADLAKMTIQKAAVPHSEFPNAPEETPWDGSGARSRLAIWASSDGSGDKDKVDWAKYRKAFLWYNSDDEEQFGSYKLPVVDVVDGKAKLIWHGVRAAYAAVSGARGGVDIPEQDKSSVISRIKRHYEDLGKEFEKGEDVFWPDDMAKTEY